ncbi:hypothetical protein SAMN02799627_02829 [Methylobacterium sp. 13MFTsu3.1M2]|nr:hypothetical protein SAMN02799627_02829 [Methylobacterium sp. 13MFTsu3.1M2]
MVRFEVGKTGRGGCAGSVTRAVQAVAPGARIEVDIEVDLATKRVTAAGFPAEPLLAAAPGDAAATGISRRHPRPGRGHGPAARTGVIPYP